MSLFLSSKKKKRGNIPKNWRCEYENHNELELTRQSDDPNDIRLKLIKTLDFYKQHSDFYLTLYQSGLKQIIQDSIIDESKLSPDLPCTLAYTISAFSYLIYGWISEWIKRGMNESSDELIAMFENDQKI